MLSSVFAAQTSLCDHFNEDDPSTWRCVWKRRCAHAHGKDDVRTKEEATEEWRAHLMTALPQQNAQLPAMLNRLLSAGAAALDTLSSSGLSKSAGRSGGGGGGVTSPSHMTHRRSTSGLSRDGSSGNLQGIGMRQTSQSARVPQLTFAGQALQMGGTSAYQQQNEVSPRSQPLTPMQQSRTPIMIHPTMPSQQQHGSPSQESPRSLPAAAIKAPAMTEARTPLGLSGGLGFFSGAESQLWAPSPKMQTQQLQQQAAAGVQMGSQSAGPPSRHLERFVFEPQPPQQPQQQPSVQSEQQAAAAWAVAAKLEEYESADRGSQSEPLMGASSFIISSTFQSQSSSHRLLLDNSTPLSPPPPHHPTLQISSTSPSPDSVLPTTVANTLWTSPIATSVTDEQRATVHAATSPPPSAQTTASFRKQLADRLMCSQDAVSSHVLQTPISTPCCGLALCKSCIDAHLAQCNATKRQPKHEGELKSDDNGVVVHNEEEASVSGPSKCKCGRPMDAADITRLRDSPVNRTLQSLTEWLRQMETGNAESNEASFKVQLTPPPPAADARSISPNAGKQQQPTAQEPPAV